MSDSVKKTVFIVDDNDTNLSTANNALKGMYRVITVPSAAKMFALLEKIPPDLILLDIEMPGIDGFQALQQLKANTQWVDIPVMFLTGRTDVNIEALCFRMGAVDYIIKPFSEPVLQHRIKTQLDIDQIVKERTAKLNRIQNGIVSVLADIVENRDKGAGGHIERTSDIIGILIEAMKENGVYIEEIREWDTEKMISSARMHDLGKVSVSDTIVNKPGKLSEEEFETMKTHSMEGERIIDEIVAITGEGSFLYNAKMFAGYHHERWDGKGYPRGLKGTEIPLQGRIMAIVDVYDAIISVRPYKNALPHEEAIEVIKSASGTQFDPAIVDVFLGVQEKIMETVKGL